MKFGFFLIQITLATLITVFQTNIHTITQAIRNVETQTTTHWSTSIHDPTTHWSTSIHDPTTTLTSTLTRTTTMASFGVDFLVAHNEKRRLHVDTPDLLWDETIASSAQNYADDYNCNGTLIHSHNSRYGENLALGFNTTAAVTAWYDEILLYDYDSPVFSTQTGHFTQLIWKSSSKIGCGWKDCGSYHGQYSICQYWTPGNWAGQFNQNVEPLR